MFDEPVSLLLGAQIGIADISAGDPTCQLRALNSDIGTFLEFA